MLTLPAWGAKQEVTSFLTSPLPCASRETSFLRKRHESINYRHFLFGKWKQEAATFLASPWCSASRGALSLRKQRESINYRRENEGTSCLASKTANDDIYGFTMVFRIPSTPSRRKRWESINYRQENAGNSCLTSKTGSEVILNFTIVFSIPRNPHPEIYGRKMLTLPCIPVKLLASLSTSNRHFIGLN